MKASRDCTYVTDAVVCEGCGFEINPVRVRVRTGYGYSRDFILRGRVHKTGGRGYPARLLCDSCFRAPRSAVGSLFMGGI